jgi:cyanate permease
VVFSAIGRTLSRVHYAWIIVAVTFAVVVVSAGVRATPGVLIVPLEQEFHWSRATISLALGINLLLFGAVGPFAAAVMDRFGARRTIAASLITTALSVVLTPAMSEPWQLILLWGSWLAYRPGSFAVIWRRISLDAGFAHEKGLSLVC